MPDNDAKHPINQNKNKGIFSTSHSDSYHKFNEEAFIEEQNQL